MTARPTTSGESGYALLFVYAMAATVAIMLYMELPRVAFEAQRDKEQLLIDRGEQYSRAVNLYVRKFNRYPADFDALQNTQNLRFLRRKYIDPMTGKDDWRIVHVGPGGVFTDSLVYGKKKDGKQQTEQQTFITEMQQTGGNQTTAGQQGVNIGTRQRQSDQPGAPGDPNNPAQPPQPDANGQQVPNPANPVNAPVQVLPDGRIVPVQMGNPQPGQQPNQPGLPGQFPQGANGFPTGFQGQSGVPSQSPFTGQPFPGQPFPGQQGAFPNQPGFPNQGGFPNQQNTVGQLANAPPSAGANLINQILTTPRPGGLNGPGFPNAPVDQNGNPTQNGNGFGTSIGTPGITLGAGNSNTGTANTGTALAPIGGQTIGGGIAGVASKLEQDGIKTYRDRTPYNEWEFVYDISKDPARGASAAAQPQTGSAAPGATPANGTTAPTGTPSPTAGSNTNPAPATAPPVTPQ